MPRSKDVMSTADVAQAYVLHDTLSHLLRRSHFHAEGLFSKSLGHFGITSRQLALMVAVAQNPDASQRRVGELIALDVNTVSDLLRRMERNGLIERRASQQDGRTRQLRLTSEGEAILAAARQDNQTLQKRLTERLTPAETEQLKSLLRQMLDLDT